MSQFEYTLPSGSSYRLNGPAGATQFQADTVFYEQVAAGSLVGYEAGQTLTSLETRLTKFDLSRLDRGTAGVDTVAVLSIIQNLPVVSGIPELVNVAVDNPIDQSDIVLARGDSLGPLPVGPLTPFQIQTLQAQLANVVDQDFTVITQEKGVGKYGLTCLQLEQVGYVKPGTFSRVLANDPNNFIAVMNSPAIWTGLGGVNNVDDILADSDIQNVIQNQLMQVSYDGLTATGVISNVSEPTVSLSQGQIYTPTGLQTLNALNILGSNSTLITNLLSQPITNLSTITSGAIINSALSLATLNISNRITGEVGALINNASKFGSLATTAWAKGLPALSAININQLTTGLNTLLPSNLSTLKSGLDTLAKASQFSLNFTNPLTSLSKIDLQGLAAGAVTNVQNQALGIVANVQGQAQGIVTNVQGSIKQLTNLFSGSGDLVSGTQIAAGFSNTVNRKTVDAAVTRILGNSKIPVPNFEYPSAASIAERLDITQAQTILNNLKGQGQAVAGQLTNTANQVQATASQAQRSINRLV